MIMKINKIMTAPTMNTTEKSEIKVQHHTLAQLRTNKSLYFLSYTNVLTILTQYYMNPSLCPICSVHVHDITPLHSHKSDCFEFEDRPRLDTWRLVWQVCICARCRIRLSRRRKLE